MSANQTLRHLYGDKTRTTEERAVLEAAIDLIESLNVDTTCGNTGDEEHPTHMVLGNVSLATCNTLGIS